MKPFKRLLAKSTTGDASLGAATLVGHIAAVMRSADVLTDMLGSAILSQLGLRHIPLDRFISTVKLGAYLHDWGKANQHFQIMVRLKDPKTCKDHQDRQTQEYLRRQWLAINERQMLRHEVLSGILATQVPDFRNWLETAPGADFKTAVWAAMGHHLKLGGSKGKAIGKIAELVDGTGTLLLIHTGHPNFKALLQMGVDRLSLGHSLPEAPGEEWQRQQLECALERLLMEFVDIEESMNEHDRRFTAAVKATVLAADVAGSALPAAGHPVETWLQKVLNLVLSADDIDGLVQQRLGENALRPFQRKVAEAQCRVTLVKAGCGTGKTVAAYAWAGKYAVGRKLFFGYPTTGTASQGYLDYAATTEIESTLMHSRAGIDLSEVLFSGEASHHKDPADPEDAEQVDARLASFRAWQAKLIVCTVDSVLGLIQNNRKPLYSWPALCQSAFVFDEVHAYDSQLFGALLRFLDTFQGAPILLMSASFSPGQLQAIEQTVARLDEFVQIIEGPTELEKIERYTLHRLTDTVDVWDQVKAALLRQERVLWVTNTVKDCVRVYSEAGQRLQELNVEPLIYHSRYRYVDRVEKHKEVVERFRSDGPVLAITTQVCEMSLDLSAHLLVTALAPAAALIQRLGRLNRHLPEGKLVQPKPALIYPWTASQPYGEELPSGDALLDLLLPQRPLSQRDLAEAAAQLPTQTPTAVYSHWVEGNWRAFPGPLREAGYTITVLLEEDVPKIWAAARRKSQPFGQEAQRWAVPIPLDPSYVQWERTGVYPIAPAARVTYDRATGAMPCKA
ncbi:MAG: CRISPR-associated helicase Cas3' [Aphanocapsa lilacina HA4352-LM1]|jgi:CRISPR-associated endonuclease/helicase Cas3|nr:CRISPR-associated helicase Cas3' [Aphanocapsa lilacina HA4352-LM1]